MEHSTKLSGVLQFISDAKMEVNVEIEIVKTIWIIRWRRGEKDEGTVTYILQELK